MASLDLRPIGVLYTPDPVPLLLGDHMPLSHLWARGRSGLIPAARALAEARGDHLRRRYAVHLDEDPADLLRRLSSTAVSPVFFVLGDSLAFLDPEQLMAIGAGLVSHPDPVELAHLHFTPTYRLDFSVPLDLRTARQFWMSDWHYEDQRQRRPDWWRVWPQGARQGIRGAFVAAMSEMQYQRLREPHYVVIESTLDPRMRLYAYAVPDRGETELNSERMRDRRIVALDASCRDALGILDSEFCRLIPSNAKRSRRNTARRLIGGRTTVAHVKIAARVDLDKPVCRLSRDTFAAVGARPDDLVIVEAVVESSGIYKPRTIKLRALEIDSDEAKARAAWERTAGADGWVDPSAVHGIHPPYPSIYLDWFSRERLGNLPVAAPVVVRASIGSRLATEAGNFAWLAVGGVIIAILKGMDASAWTIVLVALALSIVFIGLRIRHAVR